MQPVRIELSVEVVDENSGGGAGFRSAPQGFIYERILSLVNAGIKLGGWEVAAPGLFPDPVTSQTLEVDLPDMDISRLHLLVVQSTRQTDAGWINYLSAARRLLDFEATLTQWFLNENATLVLGAGTFGSFGEPTDNLGMAPRGFTCSSGRYADEQMKLYFGVTNSVSTTEVEVYYMEFQEEPEDMTEIYP